MAIANSDGSIILSTKVDTSGINKGMSQMQGKATNLTKTFSKLGAAIVSAFAIQKIIQFSNEAGQLATQTEASIQRLVDIYGSASDSVGDFIDANARALGMSKAAAASFSSVYGNLFSVWTDQATNAELTNRYLNMTAVVASKTGRTVKDVQERVRSGLLGNTEAIEDLGIFVNVKTIEMTDAFQRMANGKSWEQLDAYTQQQIRSMAILEQATAKYGDEVADTSATIRNRYKAAYEDFQNSWGNIVNTVLLPVLETLTQIFDIATKGLNALSGRSGQILENVELQEENTDKTAENIEEQTKNQKELNKELKKSLAGFDDIQILSANTADNTSGGLDGELQGLGGDLGGTAPDGSAYVEEIDETLTAIMGIVALSLAAVGLILLFTGNIGWGIGFIIAGAATLTVTMASASEFGYDGIIQMLTTIMGVAGGALLALGIILLWMGGIVGKGVAVGMIIAGGALIVSAVVAQAAFSPDDIGAWLSLIMGIAGGALLALGVILCMVGTIPLGVGMIIAGAVSLVSAVALNSDAVVEAIRGPIGIITSIVSGALLVLGIILTCSGILPLGIGLIAAGAIGLAAEVALNWDAIVTNIRNFLFENHVLVSLISGGLLILGIILCFVPGALPLAIGLIVVGAAGLAAEVALNWGSIVANIRRFLFENPMLISLISGGLLILGIILCVTGIGLPLGIGLILVGAAGLATEVALHWDTVVTNIRQYLFENPELISMISGGLLILGIILCVTGVGIPLGLGMILAGSAGLATVVAVNWSSIVDWVKNAWNAVKNFWNAHIAPVFTAKWWLDLGKTCINGLIAGFEGGINGIISAFESMINWIVDGLNKISFDIPDWLGGGSFGINLPRANFGRVKIPRLAQGTVIPPNREFLAVLGDQKQGTNIEAPLQTIVDAFKIALQGNANYGGGNTEVVLEIDGREFGRAVVEQGDRENRRIGTRLVIV